MTNEQASREEIPFAETSPEASKKAWDKPEIIAFDPVSNSQGINLQPLDGISNLTP
jgi:hypothetical protein